MLYASPLDYLDNSNNNAEACSNADDDTDGKLYVKLPNFHKHLLLNGAKGGTRTLTLIRAGDFKSPLSTNSSTLALKFKGQLLAAHCCYIT
jgi:hypothetical protein